MDIRPIRNDADHAAALETINALMDGDPAPGTPDFDSLEVLSILVEEFEARTYPIEAVTPIEAVKVRIVEKGLSQRALGELARIPESRISEALGYRRAMSLNMIRSLAQVLGLPIELLVQPYPVTERQPADA